MKAKLSVLAAALLCWAPSACSRPSPDVPSADLRNGRELFLKDCALCHGEKGDGLGPRRAGLRGRPRDFTDPSWRARAAFEGVSRTIRIGYPGSSMPSWPSLKDDEVRDLAAYVLSIGEGK